MPDVGSEVLEVALGLLFVYLVFSLVCSWLQETLALVLSWRAQSLEEGLRSMLQGKEEPAASDKVFASLIDHPRIKAMLPAKSVLRKRRSVPSYLSARTFSLTLLDILAGPEKTGRKLVDPSPEYLEACPGLDQQLAAMVDAAEGDLANLRREIEDWYDDTMNRVSGWYKRRAQVWLAIFSLLVAGIANVDTFQIVDKLRDDPITRAAVVAQAQKAGEAAGAGELEKVASDYDSIKGLELPVGWTTPADDRVAKEDPRAFPDSIDATKVLGILLTALALSLGAPFWFDALSKVSRLRPTGKPEGRRPGSANP